LSCIGTDRVLIAQSLRRSLFSLTIQILKCFIFSHQSLHLSLDMRRSPIACAHQRAPVRRSSQCWSTGTTGISGQTALVVWWLNRVVGRYQFSYLRISNTLQILNKQFLSTQLPFIHSSRWDILLNFSNHCSQTASTFNHKFVCCDFFCFLFFIFAKILFQTNYQSRINYII